jgi:hypothetical protein
MGEPDVGPDQLSITEVNLLLLLDSAGTTLLGRDGSLRWALDAEDVCDLLELAVDLIADWSGKTTSGAAIRARAAALLGATTAVAGEQGSDR